MRLAAACRSTLLAPLLVAVLAVSAWSSAAQGASALMLYFGGFGSCMVNGSLSELKAGPQIDKFVESLKASGYSDVTVLRSCFAIGSNRMFSRFDGDWGYESSPAEFLSELPAVAHDARADAVFIMGQSHGGTMAMRATLALRNYNVEGLVTFDSISIANCGPSAVRSGILTGESPQGCTEDPAEMRPFHTTIASISQRWINFYQTQFYLVHSDQIDAADENLHMTYDYADQQLFDAHGMIILDEALWSYLRAELAN